MDYAAQHLDAASAASLYLEYKTFKAQAIEQALRSQVAVDKTVQATPVVETAPMLASEYKELTNRMSRGLGSASDMARLNELERAYAEGKLIDDLHGR